MATPQITGKTCGTTPACVLTSADLRVSRKVVFPGRQLPDR